MQDQQHPHRLMRSVERRLGGVCGGIADYFAVDATLVRVGFVLLAFFSMGVGAVLAYAVLWAIMPAPDADAAARSAASSHTGASSGNGVLLIGVVLVVVGVSVAFQGLYVFWWMNWGMMRLGWPIGLIAAGALIVLASRRR